MAIPKLKKLSAIEERFAIHVRVMKLPEPVREYEFSERKFRFDFAWPARKVACECDGGTFSGGRHSTGKGYETDCEKLNLATLMGWRVFRFTGAMVKSGAAIETVIAALKETA